MVTEKCSFCRVPFIAYTTLYDENTFSLPISMFSTLGCLHVMRYINLRYLLTYLFIF